MLEGLEEDDTVLVDWGPPGEDAAGMTISRVRAGK